MTRSLLLFSALLCATAWTPAQQQKSRPDPPPPQTAQKTAAQTSEKPLPPIKDLLADVEHNEVANEALRRNYTYHVHFEQDSFDKNGALKPKIVTDSESLTIQGVRVDRLVAKDGRPLTPAEKQKEDARINKAVAKGLARKAKLQRQGKPADAKGDALMLASRFLELGTFSNLRRVVLNGRPTLVLDYAGNPNAKSRNEMEGIVRDLVGTIWIDDADHVIVKAQGHFLNDFKVMGGMVITIHAGLHFTLTLKKIDGEAWLPDLIVGEGSARILLFKKISGRIETRMSNYQKFRTGVTIIPSYRLVGPDGQILPQKTPPTTATPTPGKTIPPATSAPQSANPPPPGTPKL